MALDIQRLTLGEVAKIEELSGLPMSAIGDEDKPKGLALAAMAFVAKRRIDPKYTWNDAQTLTFDDANEILGLNDEDEPEDSATGDVLDPPSPPSSDSTPKRRSPRAK